MSGRAIALAGMAMWRLQLCHMDIVWGGVLRMMQRWVLAAALTIVVPGESAEPAVAVPVVVARGRVVLSRVAFQRPRVG